VDHIFAGCAFAKEFWAKIGIALPPDATTFSHNITTFLDLLLFHLLSSAPSLPCAAGKFGSGETVQSSEMRANLRQTLMACISDAALWKLRFPVRHRPTVEVWCGVFSAAM
jgi:hypothetical protein